MHLKTNKKNLQRKHSEHRHQQKLSAYFEPRRIMPECIAR